MDTHISSTWLKVRSGVPGELRGLEHIHRRYGALPWSAVMHPAIKLARDGFPVSEDLASAMRAASHGNDFLKRNDFLTKDPTWAIDFAPNGTRLGLGDVMTRKRYADTLEAISLHGADTFYKDSMASATVAAIHRSNGSMTMDDLRSYSAVNREPLTIKYQGYRIASCGAPASGAVALSIMKTVEGYEDFGYPESLNLSTHRLDEAMRFGYGKVSFLWCPVCKVNGIRGPVWETPII